MRQCYCILKSVHFFPQSDGHFVGRSPLFTGYPQASLLCIWYSLLAFFWRSLGAGLPLHNAIRWLCTKFLCILTFPSYRTSKQQFVVFWWFHRNRPPLGCRSTLVWLVSSSSALLVPNRRWRSPGYNGLSGRSSLANSSTTRRIQHRYSFANHVQSAGALKL